MASKPLPKLDNRLSFYRRLHPFPALATVIIHAAPDLKPAVQSLEELGAYETQRLRSLAAVLNTNQKRLRRLTLRGIMHSIVSETEPDGLADLTYVFIGNHI